MAKLPKDVDKEIKAIAYELCREYNYGSSDRIDSTTFIDMLLSRPDVGGRLKEYLPESSVRVHIKDTICGRYTKDLTAQKMSEFKPEAAVFEVYGCEVTEVGKSGDVTICRDEKSGLLYLVDYSTLVRWESALRRVLEYMAKTPAIIADPQSVKICLIVVDQTSKMTYMDKIQLNKALAFVNGKALII